MLNALCFISAFYWPALILMALLAYPLVRLVLGDQWQAASPLVQIVALANLSWFPVIVTQPVLLAVNAMRHAFLSSLIALPLSAAVLCVASLFGVEAMAASQALTHALPDLCRPDVHPTPRAVRLARDGGRAARQCRGHRLQRRAGLGALAAAGFDFDLSFGLAAVA
jgi:hypothetical protein